MLLSYLIVDNFYLLGFSTEVTNNPAIITSIGQWLSNLGLSDYESLFVNYGYDDPNFIVRKIFISRQLIILFIVI